MEQLPQIDVTIDNGKQGAHVAMMLEEAQELRAALNEQIALGEEYAHPESVPSLQELVDYCEVKIVEHCRGEKDFQGHAVGETRRGGPVWVTVPSGTSGLKLEDTVKYLVAAVHETRDVVEIEDGSAVRQTGEVPASKRAPAGS